MRQVTLRLDDDLAEDLKSVAAQRGQSVNAFAAHVLRDAVDPEWEMDPTTRLREKLRRAGLLAEPSPSEHPRPPAHEVEAAGRRAARGKPLSDYVSEDRG